VVTEQNGHGISVRLLGPVQLTTSDGAEITLATTGSRSLLAALASRPGMRLALREIVDMLWGEQAPRQAQSSVYNAVSSLRKALEPSRQRRNPAELVPSNRGGYALAVPPDAVDVHRFESAAAAARRHWTFGDPMATLTSCDVALREWRGTPFDGATGPFAESERVRLAFLRLDLIELRHAAMIETGAEQDAVTSLTVLAAEHPVRERFHELLMLALYRTGRQAEALDAFQRARRYLRDELGIEPGHALRRMHERILSGEPIPGRSRQTAGATAAAPAQLPHDIPHFTGRRAELDRVRNVCRAAAAGEEDSPVIVVVEGSAGVGKTGLVVHVAHEVAHDYPDGQLFVDMHSFDPRRPPRAPQDALEHLLRAFGVDSRPACGDLDALSALHRTTLTGKRVLLVVDNAATPDQVRPLLPGARGSLVLVTSRNTQAGLAACDGAIRVALNMLDPNESRSLLAGLLSTDTAAEDGRIFDEIARLCGHLPLALRIAAERVAGSDHLGIADLVGELHAEHGRLDALLLPDDELSGVRGVLSSSYGSLAPDDARAFRLLGLHLDVTVGLPDTAALLDVDERFAAARLESLTRRHLIDKIGRDRYRMHDLLRIYAVECADRDERPEDRGAAVERLVDWYLARIKADLERLIPGLGPVEPNGAATRSTVDLPATLVSVGKRLHARVAVFEELVSRGLDVLAARFAVSLSVHFFCVSRWDEWYSTSTTGLAAARRAGCSLDEARLRNGRGVALHYLGRPAEAVVEHKAAASILERLSVEEPSPAVEANLTVAYVMIGRHQGSIALLHQAMAMAHAQENPVMVGIVAVNLCEVLSRLHQHEAAADVGRRGVALLGVGGGPLLGHALMQLADTFLRAGRTKEASAHAMTALALWRQLGDAWGQAVSMHALARAGYALGGVDNAELLLRAALIVLHGTDPFAVNDFEIAAVRALLAEVVAPPPAIGSDSALRLWF
jgi:DNA-binding SARP family transcriptional activator/tetratricopeptide (TPR) repeat protein